MKVVIPFCVRDESSALLNLELLEKFDGKQDLTAIVSHDDHTNGGKVIDAARRVFAQVIEFTYPYWAGQPQWPYPQNNAWGQTARYVERHWRDCWLWWEPDAVPMRRGWLRELFEDYQAQAGQKPLMIQAGVGIYPPNTSQLCTNAFLARAHPWHLHFKSPELSRSIHYSRLIEDRSRAFSFDKLAEAQDTIAPETRLFHSCKDESLQRLLLEKPVELKRNRLNYTLEKPKDSIPVFYHSGDAGDIIYALLSVKRIVEQLGCGKADIYLGPEKDVLVREPFTEKKFEFIAYLILNQPYIRNVEYVKEPPDTVDYNFNRFRPYWAIAEQARLGLFTLCEVEGYAVGINVTGNTEPWIESNPIRVKPVVMSRTERYHVPDFPWQEAVARYGKEAVFVGTEKEHSLFCKEFGFVPHHKVEDALELAGVIKGADLTICNESLIDSLAESQKVNLVQETWSKACVYKRPNAINFTHSKIHWPDLTQKPIPKDSTKVHFLTIVLDGMPWIGHHLPVFNELTFAWEWHIVEGVAANIKDTKWCASIPGRLSQDGTTEYLDSLKCHPHIHVYRKPLWQGKLEMVNEPLKGIHSPAYLWQVDSDEIWTAAKITRAIQMMDNNPQLTQALFYCRYFVGPHLVVSGEGAWGNKPGEWQRLWRLYPGDRFKAHEPPIFEQDKQGYPLTRHETRKAGLVFDHYAYATQAQVEFKQNYYQYPKAVEGWQRLQKVQQFPARLKDYLPWVDDDCLVSDLKTATTIKKKLHISPGKNGSMGLGDLMLFTPIMRQMDVVLELPTPQARFKPLFDNLCEVVIADTLRYPEDKGPGHYAVQKLRALGLNEKDYLPAIHIYEDELDWAVKVSDQWKRTPIAFVPCCSPKWARLRQPPSLDYWQPLIARLAQKFWVILFRYGENKPVIPGVSQVYDDFSVRQQAALFKLIGRYLGVDTGDHHLMLSVGGRNIVLVPDNQAQYSYEFWHYQSDRIQYFNFKEREKALGLLLERF